MSEFDALDFFSDRSLVADPYPYFDHLRARCPVQREPHHDVVMVTGYDAAMDVYHDVERFSSCNSVSGPFPGFPVPLVGDDVSELIEAHRDELPMSDQLPTLDPPKHTEHRALLGRMLTPKRLKENEDFMWRLADRQIDEFLPESRCEFVSQFASPFTLLVIADLLGVPEDDHERFRDEWLGKGRTMGSTGHDPLARNPLEFLYGAFTGYIEDRRESPRDDVLTGLATATFHDGRTPEVIDVVRIAVNLFAAGQETTVRLLAAALQVIAERPDLQTRLRTDRDRIPNFVEETLRAESPVKGDFRLARVPTTVAGVDIPAGSHGDGAQRGRQPRSGTLRGPRCLPSPTGRTRASTWPSATGCTPVRGHRWRGPRLGSASSAFSTAPPTSGSRRPSTARPGSVATATCPPSCCAA